MIDFRTLLQTNLPIIQAPMAGVQDSSLALAVAAAGGLGSVPGGMLNLEALHGELSQAITASAPLNFNFFCHTPPRYDAGREERWREELQPYLEEFGIADTDIPVGASRRPFSHEVIDILELFKPEILSFHFGLPAPDLLARVKAWGATILASATTLDEARWLDQHGADVIIAQGFEAGGHRGIFLTRDLSTQVGTFSLVAQITHHLDRPVIAAGGIADARGVAAAIKAGAIAAQLGTAYLLCSETKTSQIHRAALKSDRAHQTVITNLFSGRPARGIVNRVINDIGPLNDHTPEYPLAASAISTLRRQAEQAGSGDFSPLWCGQNPTGCQEISATQLTQQLAAEL